MTADHDRLESRLRGFYSEQPTVAATARLDGLVSAAISVPRVTSPRSPFGGFGRRVSAMATGIVVVATVVALGFAAWAVAPFAAPELSHVGAADAASPSTAAAIVSAEPSDASPTPERIVITPPPDPIPMMDAERVLRMLEADPEGPSTWWWSPDRAMGRFGRMDERADGRVELGLGSGLPADAEVELEARPDGVVRIRSRSDRPGAPDPLGCAPDSFGRYQIAATELRLDLVPIADRCAARVAAVAGTWRAAQRWYDDAVLVPTSAVPGGAFTVSRTLAGASVPGEGQGARGRRLELIPESRDGDPGSTPHRVFELHRPDASVRVGFPIDSVAGPCDPPALHASDQPFRSLDTAIEHLQLRPGITVENIQSIRYPGIRVVRVDVQRDGDPSPCIDPSLFDTLDTDERPMWPVPWPAPDQQAPAVYLAQVPAHEGEALVVALLVLPPERPAETSRTSTPTDMIVTQVLFAIDWRPERHPPDWDVPAG